MRSITSTSPERALLIVVVVTLVVIGTRLLFVYLTAQVARLRRRRIMDPSQGPSSWRVGTVAGWSGFRGAVSLAAALAVPTMTVGGRPVVERDLIIFVTALVIVLIMLLQGTTLPLVVRWAGLSGDPERVDEAQHARRRATEVGLAALPQVAAEVGAQDDSVRRLEAEYQRHLEDLNEGGGKTAEERRLERQLRLGVLAHKRREVTRLRDNREIDDLVLAGAPVRAGQRGDPAAGARAQRVTVDGGPSGAAQSTWARNRRSRGCSARSKIASGGPASSTTPPVHEGDGVGDLPGEAHLVGDHHHGHAGGGQVGHHRRARP